MPQLFPELRERLLRTGVAPRHVRRYIDELSDHLADVKAEEEGAGRIPSDAEAAALARLGSVDDLSRAMTGHRQFQSWCARAPWAMFGLVPLSLLTAAYLVACLILWSGWEIFLPGTDTPFVPVDGLALFYFGAGRLLYFSAPLLVGWGIVLVAAHQRLRAVWPSCGVALVALAGSMAQVHASRAASGVRHVSMHLGLGPSFEGMERDVFHALAIFSIAVLPYFIWRLQARSFPA